MRLTSLIITVSLTVVSSSPLRPIEQPISRVSTTRSHLSFQEQALAPTAAASPLDMEIGQETRCLVIKSIPASSIHRSKKLLEFLPELAIFLPLVAAISAVRRTWPTPVLTWISPSQLNHGLLWGGEATLIALGVLVGLHLRSIFRDWYERFAEGEPRARIFPTVGGSVIIVLMLCWPTIFYQRPNMALRDQLASFAIQAHYPDQPGMDTGLQRFFNTLAFGEVEPIHDFFTLMAASENKLLVSDQVLPLRGDLSWVDYVLYHEARHMTREQITVNARRAAYLADAERHVRMAIDPSKLAKAEALGPKTLEQLFHLGLWLPSTLKHDPKLNEDIRQFLRNYFAAEIPAQYGETWLLNSRKPSDISLVDFAARRLQAAYPSRHLSAEQFVARYDARSMDFSMTQAYFVEAYRLAKAFDPRGITPEYAKAVLRERMHGEAGFMVIPFLKANYDSHFDFDFLEATGPRAREYQKKLYAWFYKAVMLANESGLLEQKSGSSLQGPAPNRLSPVYRAA